MQIYLFSDSEVWHAEIHAKTFIGALRKARMQFGIAVPLRLVAEYGANRDYRAYTGYECSIRLVY